MRPRLEREAREANGDFLLVFVDTDDCPALTNQYQARSVPTVVAFVNNREAGRFTGLYAQADLHKFVKALPTPN